MLLLGEPVVEELRRSQKNRIEKSGITPRLAAVQAGDDPASTKYIQMKKQYGESIGAELIHIRTSAILEDLHSTLGDLNADTSIHGIITQLPLPDPSITDQVLAAIDPKKDVDGLNPDSQFKAGTAMAVIKLMEGYDIPIKGSKVAMVGYGRLVGKPLTAILRERGAVVTVCDITTKDLEAETLRAEIIVSATGKPSLIKPGMVNDGSVIIDVGTAEDQGAIVGDADPALLKNDGLRVSPPKGGVGPITVAVLWEHTLKAGGI